MSLESSFTETTCRDSSISTAPNSNLSSISVAPDNASTPDI